MNIPENILQQVADAAFQNAPHTHNHLIARKIGLGITWEDQSQARLTVIQHALSNPALAPFLAAEPTPPAEPEPAAQVPLGPEDVKPGAALKMPNWEEGAWRIVIETDKEGIWLAYVKTGAERVSYKNLFVTGAKINTSIPDTGRWDANAWRPCSKPGKEVAK